MSMLRSGARLFASHGAAAVMSFLRNVIVARALGVEEFGVASTFAVLFALVEIATDTGLEKMIVRDPQGDEEDFQGTMQTFYVARGFIAAGFMLALSGPFAHYMGLGDIVWAYQLFALTPVIRGFVHFDIYREQRRMRFGGFIASTLAAPFTALVIVAAGTAFISDFRIVLFALFGFQIAFVLASHLAATRPFRLSWNREVLRRSISFGLPLLLNGALVFASMQGSRMIIGGEIGIEVLGWFSVAWLLSSTPTFVLINTIRSVFLPKLSEGLAEGGGLTEETVTATMQASCLAAILIVSGFFVLGPYVLLFVYGNEFSAALSVLQPIAVAFAIRIVASGAIAIALAGNDTPTALVCGITRALFLPIAFLAASSGYGTVTVAWIFMAGELASLVTGSFRLVRKCALNAVPWIPALALSFLAALMALGFDCLIIQPHEETNPRPWMIAAFFCLAAFALLPMRELWRTLGHGGR